MISKLRTNSLFLCALQRLGRAKEIARLRESSTGMLPNLKVCEMENEMGKGKRKRTGSPNLIKSHEIRERLSRVTNVENSCGTTDNRDMSVT